MQTFVGKNVIKNLKIITYKIRTRRGICKKTWKKILKKALNIKKRNIIEDSIIEKVLGFDDIPIEKMNILGKKLELKKNKSLKF